MSIATELFDRYARKGRGFVPCDTAAEAERIAAAGRLWHVDTASRGADCLIEASAGAEALAFVASDEEPELSAAHEDGAAGWARARGWTATQVTG